MFRQVLFSGGVHPKGNKNTHYSPIVLIGPIKQVRIPMSMHIGPPCVCLVKPGDLVEIGQVIGQAEAPMAVPIHASVSGKVTAIRKEVASNGKLVDVVTIESDGQNTIHARVIPPIVTNREEFISAVRDSGLVGLGGAGFPTHIKMKPPPDKAPDTLVINAAECEPYVTVDFRLCLDHPDEIIQGIVQVMKFMNIPRALIGIENNKPQAVESLNQELSRQKSSGNASPDISVVSLRTIYPQGAEKMLTYALTRRKIPAGGLPHDVGVLVLNVGTVRYIAKYLQTGLPLVSRWLTVDGSGVHAPVNFDVPIGTPIADVLKAAGVADEDAGKVIMGGPMMGVAQDRLETAIIKNNNAILVFGHKDAVIPEESSCIHCARCVKVCPMSLSPTNLDELARRKDLAGLAEYHILDCIECGCCTYVCPAKRYLVQSIRNGKSYVQMARSKEAALK